MGTKQLTSTKTNAVAFGLYMGHRRTAMRVSYLLGKLAGIEQSDLMKNVAGNYAEMVEFKRQSGNEKAALKVLRTGVKYTAKRGGVPTELLNLAEEMGQIFEESGDLQNARRARKIIRDNTQSVEHREQSLPKLAATYEELGDKQPTYERMKHYYAKADQIDTDPEAVARRAKKLGDYCDRMAGRPTATYEWMKKWYKLARAHTPENDLAREQAMWTYCKQQVAKGKYDADQWNTRATMHRVNVEMKQLNDAASVVPKVRTLDAMLRE